MFSKNSQLLNIMKILPVGAEFHADRQTCMAKLIVAFRNFANAPKTCSLLRYLQAVSDVPVFPQTLRVFFESSSHRLCFIRTS